MSQSNLEKYRVDLKKLIDSGDMLHMGVQHEYHPKEFADAYKKDGGNAKYEDYVKKLPRFSFGYQRWYSEALAVVKQLIPDRLSDFTRLYEKPKTRKEITYENYMIEDLLQGLAVTRSSDKRVLVNGAAAIPRFAQQVEILKSAQGRFESSLFDIRQLVQADLFDSELEVARELHKNKFLRAAGAVTGVVLEKHLAQVCANHNISVSKKNPTIGDFNDLLRNGNVIETPQGDRYSISQIYGIFATTTRARNRRAKRSTI
jgi:hypothetical protein